MQSLATTVVDYANKQLNETRIPDEDSITHIPKENRPCHEVSGLVWASGGNVP